MCHYRTVQAKDVITGVPHIHRPDLKPKATKLRGEGTLSYFCVTLKFYALPCFLSPSWWQTNKSFLRISGLLFQISRRGTRWQKTGILGISAWMWPLKTVSSGGNFSLAYTLLVEKRRKKCITKRYHLPKKSPILPALLFCCYARLLRVTVFVAWMELVPKNARAKPPERFTAPRQR